VEDWALIRRLVADGVPQRQVARDLGISRATVARALASDRPPKYERKPAPTSFTPFEPRVRALLAEHPDMPATVVAERVEWTGSITWFRDNVRRLRPEHRRADPAGRLTWVAGDAAQCDLWFPPRKILLEDGSRVLLPVLVITLAYSRFMLGRMIPTRRTEDLLLATWELLGVLGRVPRRLIWDNEPGIGRGKRHAEGVAGFTGTLATTLVRLPPRGSGVERDRGAAQRLLRDLLHAGPRLQLADRTRRSSRRCGTTSAIRGCSRARRTPASPIPPPLRTGASTTSRSRPGSRRGMRTCQRRLRRTTGRWWRT
jgi:hypothetical protein